MEVKLDSSAQITPCGHNSLQSAVQLGLLAAAAAKSSPSGWLTAEMGVCRRRSSRAQLSGGKAKRSFAAEMQKSLFLQSKQQSKLFLAEQAF